MGRQLFINLPVADLDASVAFFTALGFEFNAQFTDENATSMIIGEDAFAMLLVKPFFSTFTSKAIADTSTTAEVIMAISADSREEVDALAAKAFAAGATKYNDPQDMGFMYSTSFQDLDGHLWEVMWMDPSTVEQAPN